MKGRPARLLLLIGLGALAVLVLGRLAAGLYTEAMWYGQAGFAASWWKRLGTAATLRVVTSLIGAGAVLLSLSRVVRYLGPVHLRRRYGNLEIAEQVPRLHIQVGLAAIAALAGWWIAALSFPAAAATEFLAWWHRAPWGVRDPILGHDLSFYVFTLPIVRRTLAFLLLLVTWSAMLVIVGYALVGAIRVRSGRIEIDPLPRSHFAALAAATLALLGAQFWLGRYDLLTAGSGFGGVTGYTDVNARLAARAIMAVGCLAAALVTVHAASRRRWLPAFAAIAALVLTFLVAGVAWPGFVQRLRVVPNELEREAPFLAHNLEFTRLAFGLSGISRDSMRLRAGAEGLALKPYTSRQPLWDEGPLQAAYNQMQAQRGYYQFPSVHFDRYGAPGNPAPVAISVREFTVRGLPDDAASSWRTLHLNVEQVRGNGAVISPIATKTMEGNPVFWLRGVEPVQRAADAPPEVTMRDPTILFGETTTDWILVTDSARAAGAPSGVRLDSFLRVFAFAWRLGDGNLLFSGEVNRESQILIRRQVRERVDAIAPFLSWSATPHPVLFEGRLVWVLDGYSVSAGFPLARAFVLNGTGAVRYTRNSVKATVDALTGAVRLYVLDAEEPLVAAWARAFPGLFSPIAEMPDGIRRHLVYPRRLLQLQARVLEDYHVEEPAAFFSGVNAWQVPLEPGPTSAGREYTPIFVLGDAGDGGGASFQLVVPFIARERQNMTALLAAENDGDRYGRLTLRELPREAQVTGPRQVRTLIEQDPTISAQLTLWRQGGSDVELGRLRVLPMDGWILYIQPVFLLGSGGSIPQLQRVVASDGTIVVIGNTLDEATAGLAGRDTSAVMPVVGAVPDGDWAERALGLFRDAERSLRDGDWTAFGSRWSELQALLERAARDAGR